MTSGERLLLTNGPDERYLDRHAIDGRERAPTAIPWAKGGDPRERGTVRPIPAGQELADRHGGRARQVRVATRPGAAILGAVGVVVHALASGTWWAHGRAALVVVAQIVAVFAMSRLMPPCTTERAG